MKGTSNGHRQAHGCVLCFEKDLSVMPLRRAVYLSSQLEPFPPGGERVDLGGCMYATQSALAVSFFFFCFCILCECANDESRGAVLGGFRDGQTC